MQRSARGLSKFTDLRTSVRNLPSFNIGGGNQDIDFVLRGPELRRWRLMRRNCVSRSQKLGVMDADTTLKLDNPELRVEIDRKRAADLGVDTEHIASALRIMVGGDEEVSRFLDPSVNEEYDVQLRLSQTIEKMSGPSLGSTFRARKPVSCGSTIWCRSRRPEPDAYRPPGSSTPGELARSVAPGYALADRIEALNRAVREMNLPADYTTSVSGRGRELERTFTGFSGHSCFRSSSCT